jgi:hypothetical protein
MRPLPRRPARPQPWPGKPANFRTQAGLPDTEQNPHSQEDKDEILHNSLVNTVSRLSRDQTGPLSVILSVAKDLAL